MPSPDPEKLELLIHKTLCSLPERKAPRTLEARVLAALDERAALPWWRRSYCHWPRALRYIFIGLLAVAAAALLALDNSHVTARAVGQVALHFPWIAFMRSAVGNFAEAVRIVLDAVPPGWITGVVVLVGGCYALLFGLGAAAYRAFSRDRPPLRHFS
jgi:hypothetical protein